MNKIRIIKTENFVIKVKGELTTEDWKLLKIIVTEIEKAFGDKRDN